MFNLPLPILTMGGLVLRRGNTTSLMTSDRYRKMLLEGVHATVRWELCEAPDVTLDDLDTEEILRTVRIGKSVRRLPEIIGTDILDILKRLGLLTDENKPNRAALVLFAKHPIGRFSQCVIRLARFKGNTKAEFLDNKMVEGNAFLSTPRSCSLSLAPSFYRGSSGSQGKPKEKKK